MFERLYIEISNICNLQCHFCPEVVREKKILSVQDFRYFAEQAQPLTKQVCLHLMGEPLAHPQFKEIMRICEELQLRVFLTTNGTLLNKHADDLLKWKSLDQINFSVHSYFANSTKISLEQYLDPILSFCDQSLESQNRFYINLRLWNLPSTHEQHSQNERVFQILNRHFKTAIDPQLDVRRQKSKNLKSLIFLHFDTEFIWPSLDQSIKSQKGSCYGLRKQIGIHANGDVVPCCLDKESVLKLGNLHETKLTDILKSTRAQNIKNGFEKNELREELCQKCHYAERFQKKESFAKYTYE